MKRLALLGLLVIAGCGSLGAAQPHTLSLAFKPGDSYKYKFHATSKQTAGLGGMSVPVDVDTSASETVAVKSVDGSGVADLTISLSNFTLKTTAGGVTNTTTGLPANSVEVKIRSDGTVVSIDGRSMMQSSPLAAFAGIGGAYFIAAVFPDHAVKAGDSWTKAYDQESATGSGASIHISSHSKYLRDENVNGVNAAVVETKSTGTITMAIPSRPTAAGATAGSIDGTFTTDVTSWIDPSGHRIVKSHSTSTDDLTITLPADPSSSTQSPFPIQGPLTAKGSGTADLTPA